MSMPSSICMVVTPVARSPQTNAHWIGDGPRWRGSRLGWRLTKPCRGISSRLARDQLAVGHHHDGIGTALVEHSQSISSTSGCWAADTRSERHGRPRLPAVE